jgi:hypothetical protein
VRILDQLISRQYALRMLNEGQQQIGATAFTPSRFRSMSQHRHLFQVGHIAKAKPEQTFPRKHTLTLILYKQCNLLIYNNINCAYQSMP